MRKIYKYFIGAIVLIGGVYGGMQVSAIVSDVKPDFDTKWWGPEKLPPEGIRYINAKYGGHLGELLGSYFTCSQTGPLPKDESPKIESPKKESPRRGIEKEVIKL